MSGSHTPVDETPGESSHGPRAEVLPAFRADGDVGPEQQARCVTTESLDGSGSRRPLVTPEYQWAEKVLSSRAASAGATGRFRTEGKHTQEEWAVRQFGLAMKQQMKKMAADAEGEAEGNDFETGDAYPGDSVLSRAPRQNGGCSGKDQSTTKAEVSDGGEPPF